MNGSVTVHMDAQPMQIWELLSDITRIGEYSPETFEAEWLDGATGPAVGARFRGHVKRNGIGPIYWTTCYVSNCIPGSEFGFGVGSAKRPVNVWLYQLAPSGNGTDVTESFSLGNIALVRVYWALFGWSRGRTNRNGMRITLECIRAEVE